MRARKAAVPVGLFDDHTSPEEQVERPAALRAVPHETLDGRDESGPAGLPMRRWPGLTYAQSIAVWLQRQGVVFPPRDRRDESYAIVMRHAMACFPDNHPRRLDAAMGIACDFVADITGEKLPNGERSHLRHLMGIHGPEETFAAAIEGIRWGAGLASAYEGQELNLTRYATSVLVKRAREQAG